ncbi:MAG: ABC transporter substrate-binding protein [Planctomycetaceae bacterium]
MRAGNSAIPLVLVAVAAMTGCRRGTAEPALPPPEATGVGAAAGAVPPERGRVAFARPESLAALERQVTWVDRPVRDPREPRSPDEASEPTAVAEALAIPNDSPQDNARLLAALFHPPEPGARANVDRVRRHLAAEVASLNPVLAETTGEFDVAELTGVGLFGFDRELSPFANADTVRSWQSSADGLIDKVVLRDDLTWSDGIPITAHDVAFTWQVIIDRRVPARAFRDGAARIRGVHAYDDRTVVFFRAEPLATNAGDIDFPVLPRHRYADSWERDPTLASSAEHAALEARPVTGGPYEVASRDAGREIVLRRRAGWSTVRGRRVREAAPFAEIRFLVVEDPDAALEALEAGDLDEALLTPRQWATGTTHPEFSDRLTKVMAPTWRSYQIAWNLDAPVFADRRVRRAMGYAIDHSRLLDTLCHGLAAPASGAFPPGSWPNARRRFEPYRQDLDNAEALLDEAGWGDHDGDRVRDREIAGRRVPFEFTILCDHRPFQVAICTLVRDCLARVGVNCVVDAVEPGVLRERLAGRQFDACLVSWVGGVDPDAAESLWGSTGARNHCGYANADVDRLFVEGRRERDRDRRAVTYARIEDLLAEDQPCTWLFWLQESRALAKRVASDAFDLRGAAHWAPGLTSLRQLTLD